MAFSIENWRCGGVISGDEGDWVSLSLREGSSFWSIGNRLKTTSIHQYSRAKLPIARASSVKVAVVYPNRVVSSETNSCDSPSAILLNA